MSDQHLLTLIVPVNLEEVLVDWLLENASDQAFCSFPVSGHSIRHRGLSPAEQVSGRKRQIRFDIQLSIEASPAILQRLKSRFAGVGIEYWITPQRDADII